MVARNFSLQETPYSRLLEVPDDNREFLNLEELTPHQLTELGIQNSQHHQQIRNTSSSPKHVQIIGQRTTHIFGVGGGGQSSSQIYYDLNNAQNNAEYVFILAQITLFLLRLFTFLPSRNSCLVYMGEMTQSIHNVDSNNAGTTSMDEHKDQIQKMHPPAHSPTCIGSSRKRKSFYT